ncbi:MAG TPA: sialidase family protein [Gemmataceae bacterium]|nr:sialidase family protein [Gemmataceae bacterium]
MPPQQDPTAGNRGPRKLGGLLLLLTSGVALLLAEPAPGDGQPPAAQSDTAAMPRIARVTPPEATAAVEVSVAINPTKPDHMVAVSIAKMKKHPGISDFAYVTNDAGRTWKMVPRDNERKNQQGDDVITFTPDGVAVHCFIAYVGIRTAKPKIANNGIITGTSRDGLTWNPHVPVIEHLNTVEPFEDKPWIKADMGPDSPHRGNLYVAWTRFDVYGSKNAEHKTHIYFSRSKDAGKSFDMPQRLSEKPGDARDHSGSVEGACPAAGPKGEVYVVWAGPYNLFFTKSTDGGVNFGKNKVIADCPGWDFPIGGLGRANGMPSMGVDITQGKDRGTIYVCWGDARNGDPDVFLMTSRDGGETWSKPLRVNNDAKGNKKDQWFPWMAVDPVDGSLNIAYYDRGAHKGTFTDVTLARSVDGGRTFVFHKANKEAYDLSKLGFFGDYLGIDSYGGRVAVLWMHPLDGTKQLGISSAVFDFEPGTQKMRVEKKEVGGKK